MIPHLKLKINYNFLIDTLISNLIFKEFEVQVKIITVSALMIIKINYYMHLC